LARENFLGQSQCPAASFQPCPKCDYIVHNADRTPNETNDIPYKNASVAIMIRVRSLPEHEHYHEATTQWWMD
jgi:hypothetical protein